MDRSKKRGRRAHGQKGHSYRTRSSCKLSSHNALHDILKSKPEPSGSSKIDKGNMPGQTYLNICTYNTRTLRTEEVLETLLDELTDFKWDVIGLAETKREGQGIEELQGGAWLYNHGKTDEDKEATGIGFLLHPRITDYVNKIKSYSNRVVALNIQLSGKDQFCIIQVYAPTSDYDDEAVEAFYEAVNKAVEENKARYTIVMGDFNAKIGECQPEEETIIGKFGYGQRNARGDTLLEFAAQHKFIVANTFFEKRKDRYWTWESPDGNTHNQIDYILSSQRGIIQDCGVISRVDIGSDHRMVRAKVHLNRKLARLKFIKKGHKSKINILKLKEKRQKFQLELRNRFECLPIEETGVDERCQLICDTVLEVAAETAPPDKKKKLISEEDKVIETLDRKRKELKEIQNKTKAQKIEHAELVKTVRKKRRQKSSQDLTETYEKHPR